MLVSFEILIVFVAGLVMGSFATALSWRVPQKQGWTVDTVRGVADKKLSRSACAECGHKLAPLDLVPVLSWFFLRGKCRYCKQPISSRYPVIELTCGLAAFLCYIVYGFSPVTGLFIAALPFFMALLLIDLKHFMLPDQLNAILAGIGAVLYVSSSPYNLMVLSFSIDKAIYLGSWLLYPVFALLIAFVMKVILKRDALGYGDVKFFGVAGLWLGASFLPLFLFFAGIFGVILGLVYRFTVKQLFFPFGPALICALYVVFLFKGLGLTL